MSRRGELQADDIAAEFDLSPVKRTSIALPEQWEAYADKSSGGVVYVEFVLAFFIFVFDSSLTWLTISHAQQRTSWYHPSKLQQAKVRDEYELDRTGMLIDALADDLCHRIVLQCG
jgi:hypothetical protein